MQPTASEREPTRLLWLLSVDGAAVEVVGTSKDLHKDSTMTIEEGQVVQEVVVVGMARIRGTAVSNLMAEATTTGEDTAMEEVVVVVVTAEVVDILNAECRRTTPAIHSLHLHHLPEAQAQAAILNLESESLDGVMKRTRSR
jgi:hypothetical protein